MDRATEFKDAVVLDAYDLNVLLGPLSSSFAWASMHDEGLVDFLLRSCFWGLDVYFSS